MDRQQSAVLVLRKTLLSRKPDPLAFFSLALTTLGIVLLSILAWLNIAEIDSWFRASRESVFVHHEYWRAWTTVFIHADAKHLIGNSFLFFILGSFLAGYFGIFTVLAAGFISGGLINLLVLSSMPLKTELIGLSGVVFWMGGAWLILYSLIDRTRTVTQRLLRAMGVGLVLFMPADAFDPSVSYQSHLIGLFLGIITGLIYFFLERKSLRRAEVYEAMLSEDESTAAL